MNTTYNTYNDFMMAFDCFYCAYSTIIPILIYNNADTMKQDIIKNNVKKIGVYRWKNNITGDCYIGSSTNLSNRLRMYFRYDIISDATKGNSIIHSALLKYGYSNFSLEILEYCDKDVVLNREQHYLDTLSPAYNILKVAGSNYGHRQREESILKRVSTFTENKKAKQALKPIESKENKISINFPLQGSTRSLETIELMRKNHSRSKVVYQYNSDKITLIAKYDSLRQAQEKTGLTREYISRCIKADKLAHNGSWFSFTEL